MSRKRSRKVLYEVSNEVKKARKSRAKQEIFKRAKAFTKNITSGRAADIKEKSVIKPVGLKRNLIVFAGRLMNFSVKKALIVLVIFAVVVLLWPSGVNEESVLPGEGSDSGMTGNTESSGEAGNTEVVTPLGGGVEGGPEVVVDGPPKDHYIVIASHTDAEQLKVLASYFMLNGIETEYKTSGEWHILITKERYIKPGDEQSKIDEAKANIKKIGGKYEPPAGYKPFKFNDIYERKER